MQPLEYTLKLANAAFQGPLNQSGQSLSRFTGLANQTSAALGRAGGGMGSLTALAGRMAAAVGGAAAVWAGLKTAIGGAANLESTSVAFRTLIGDVDLAKETIGQLRELGASTPFEFPELADAGRKLISFGVAAGEVRDTLSRVGDVASGVQAPIGEIAEIYGKARVQNQLFAEDINQLTGRGIPIIAELAKVLSVSEDQIKKLAEQGKLTFPLLDQAFRNMTAQGGKFAGMMQQQSQTTKGLFSTLKDELGAVFTGLGTQINDALLKPAMQGGSALIGIFKGAVAQGRLGELLEASLSAGMASFGNFALAAFDGIVRFAKAGFSTIFSSDFNNVLPAVFSAMPDLLAGLGDLIRARLGGAFADITAAFQAGLEFALQKLVAGMQGIGLGKIIPGLDDLRSNQSYADLFKEYRADNHDTEGLDKSGRAKIEAGLSQLGEAFSQVGKKFLAELQNEFQGFKAKDVLGAGGKLQKLGETMKGIDPAAFAKFVSAISGIPLAPDGKGVAQAGQAAGLSDALKKAVGGDGKDAKKALELAFDRQIFDLETNIAELRERGRDRALSKAERELKILQLQHSLQEKMKVGADEARAMAERRVNAEDGRRKIMGVKPPPQWGMDGLRPHAAVNARAFAARGGDEVMKAVGEAAARQPGAFGALQRLKQAGVKVGERFDPLFRPPGQVKAEQEAKARAEADARKKAEQQKPKWDVVERIQDTLAKLAVA